MGQTTTNQKLVSPLLFRKVNKSDLAHLQKTGILTLKELQCTTKCLEICSTVKLDFKNRQDKNQLGFKNQITNDQLGKISFKNRQDKNQLDFQNQIGIDQKFS